MTCSCIRTCAMGQRSAPTRMDLMDQRLVWLLVAAVCAAGAIALIAVLRRRQAPVAEKLEKNETPVAAVARTHFAVGGGYVAIGGVVRWATTDPALRILPGHVLHHTPGGDGHTVTVVLADDAAPEEHRA